MSTRRNYRSELRDQQAQETRTRIRRSARELFASQGFADTTVRAIADGAGVAPQTVYAVFGSKSGIVAAMLEDLEHSAGMDEWVARIRAEDDPRTQLALFIEWIRTLFEHGAPIWRTTLAARNDPDVANIAEQGDANRHRAAQELAHLWHGKGALRPELEPEDAADRLWLLTSVEQFLFAIDTVGWSPDQYQQWLAALADQHLMRGRRRRG